MPFNSRGQYRKSNHYDLIFDAFRGSKYRMMRKDDEGYVNDIMDDLNNLKVGEVTFDRYMKFKGGKFYNKIIVTGKLKTQAEGVFEFIRRIEEIYVRR